MSENVVEPTAGAIPSLNAKDNAKVLGAPSSKVRSKSNVGKLFILIGILIGMLFVVFGLLWFFKGRQPKAATTPITLGAKASGIGDKNSAVDNAGIEKLKDQIHKDDKLKEDSDNAAKLQALAAMEKARADAAKAGGGNPGQAGADAHAPGAAPGAAPGGAGGANQHGDKNAPPKQLTPEERKYSGQVLVDYSEQKKKSEMSAGSAPPSPYPAQALSVGGNQGFAALGGGKPEGGDALASALEPTVLARREAGVLPNLDYLLKRGASIPCALQTGIDTTLAGFVVCKVMEDVYSANGKTLLIERDATVFGEQRSALKQGQERTFILWTRIDNPSGVYAQVDSPGTDQMGYNGIPGYVETHFWTRFGGAILMSLVQDYGNYLVAKEGANNNGSAPSYTTTTNTGSNMASEALRNSINIPPTLRVLPATVVYVLVARDVSFENVYTLIK
jgi:type IV secretion system protein VirB10